MNVGVHVGVDVRWRFRRMRLRSNTRLAKTSSLHAPSTFDYTVVSKLAMDEEEPTKTGTPRPVMFTGFVLQLGPSAL